MFLLGIMCLVATGLFWVLVGAIVGEAERRGISTALMMLLLAMGVALFCVGVLACHPDPQGALRTRALAAACLFGCGFFDYLMFLTMGRAMRNGPNGIIWTVTQSGVIFPFLFGVCFYAVPLNLLRGLGMVAILTALVCNGMAKERAGRAGGTVVAGNWRLWMFLAMLCCGANQVFSNWPSYYPQVREGFSAYSRTLWMHLGYLAGFACSENRRLLRREYWRQLRDGRLWLFSLVWTAGTLGVSFWLFYRGIDWVTAAGHGAICYPVMVCACLVGFPIYAVLLLRERCTPLQWAALAAGVVGMVLVACDT